MPVQIHGNSMNPTYEDGQYVLSFRNKPSIKRWDVVLIKGEKTENDCWIKRVVGMPGETIEMKDGLLLVNCTVVSDQGMVQDSTTSFGPIKLGMDEYYVLGDNRSISFDSRYIGPVTDKDIIGVHAISIKNAFRREIR